MNISKEDETITITALDLPYYISICSYVNVEFAKPSLYMSMPIETAKVLYEKLGNILKEG